MKIGIIADVHFRGNSPINRKDDFTESLIAKFSEALAIFKQEKCNIIVDAGDLLHSSIISLVLCDKICNLIEKIDIQYYAVAGNHPMLNGHWKNSEATTLAHMYRRINKLKYLTDINFANIVYIKGYEYYYGIEEEIKKNGLMSTNAAKLKIAVVHAMITPDKMMDKISHIPYKELKTNYDVVILGHYHQPIGIQKINNGKTLILSPGALGRLSIIDDYNPQVYIYDTEKNKTSVKPITCAKPYSEVFDVTAIETKKDNELMLSSFISELEGIQAKQDISVEGIVQEIWKQKNFEPEVLKLILDKIGEQQNGL